MSRTAGIGVRWTMGDVSEHGYDALRFSILGAQRLFGRDAAYAVCVNGVAVDAVRARVGPLPQPVRWIRSEGRIPKVLRRFLDGGMAEGVGWKLAPLRVFPDRFELALDNDCILWALPRAISRWLGAGSGFVVAEDVKACLGRFAHLCSPGPRNLGIRGLPPGFDLGAALGRVLARHPVKLESELDEQGLQLAALEASGEVRVVKTEEVTICSPFWPQQPWLGSCGAHFVGLNARALPFRYYERPASECVAENWERLLPELRIRVPEVPSPRAPPSILG